MSTSLPQVGAAIHAAENNGPLIRRGVLDALAYPFGQILHYSYRIRQGPGSLRKRGDSAPTMARE